MIPWEAPESSASGSGQIAAEKLPTVILTLGRERLYFQGQRKPVSVFIGSSSTCTSAAIPCQLLSQVEPMEASTGLSTSAAIAADVAFHPVPVCVETADLRARSPPQEGGPQAAPLGLGGRAGQTQVDTLTSLMQTSIREQEEKEGVREEQQTNKTMEVVWKEEEAQGSRCGPPSECAAGVGGLDGDADTPMEADQEAVHEEGCGQMRGDTEANEGEALTNEGEGLTNKGEGLTNEGEGLANEGGALTNEGEALKNEGEALTNEAEALTNEGVAGKNCELGGFEGNGDQRQPQEEGPPAMETAEVSPVEETSNGEVVGAREEGVAPGGGHSVGTDKEAPPRPTVDSSPQELHNGSV